MRAVVVVETGRNSAKAIIPPMVISVVVWLIGKLSERDTIQALAKVTAWMLILSATWTNLYGHLLGIVWAAWGINPGDVLAAAGMLAFLLLSPAVTHFIVIPKYRRSYPGVSLPWSKSRFVTSYVITHVLLVLSIAAYVTPN